MVGWKAKASIASRSVAFPGLVAHIVQPARLPSLGVCMSGSPYRAVQGWPAWPG